jgi:soluble lytic murein transglycosylase-like protein
MNNLNLKIDNSLKHISQMPASNSKYDSVQKTKIASAAKQFESILTSMMLKSMDKTTGGMLGEEGYGNDMFDTVFEQEIASYISNTKSLGLAEDLYRRITGEDMTPEMKTKINNRISHSSFNYSTVSPVASTVSPDASPVKPSSGSLERLNKYDDHIEEAAKSYGVDKNIIKSVIMTESAGNNKAVSNAKAKGLMQLMDSTASDMGVSNVFNPRENIIGGTKYLSQMLRQYNGDLKLALAAYNAGPKNVEKYNGVPPFEETKNYINKVMSYLNHFESEQ